MTDREKLIDLIREVEHTCRQVECWDCKIYVLEDGNCQAEPIADHLISKGVTIPVRCGECKYWMGEILGNRCKYHSGMEHITMMPPEGFCSCGERQGNED